MFAKGYFVLGLLTLEPFSGHQNFVDISADQKVKNFGKPNLRRCKTFNNLFFQKESFCSLEPRKKISQKIVEEEKKILSWSSDFGILLLFGFKESWLEAGAISWRFFFTSLPTFRPIRHERIGWQHLSRIKDRSFLAT